MINNTFITPGTNSTTKKKRQNSIMTTTTTNTFSGDNNHRTSSTTTTQSGLNYHVNTHPCSTASVAPMNFPDVLESKPDESDNKTDASFSPLPAWLRFYVYGLHGVFDEVVFTALYDLYHADKGNRQLLGYSTLFSFFMYASCSYFVERLYIRLYYKHGVPVYVRIPIYLAVLYAWELTSGLLLRQLGACSWDYSHYDYNFMGLITLEYAPAWCILCIIQDLLSDFLLALRFVKKTKTKLE